MATNTSTISIFLSYNWDSQQEVKMLHKFLNEKGFQSWMDIRQLSGGDVLTDELAKAILSAELLICCITKKYAESEMCKNEINFALKNRKKILPLMFENLNDEVLKGIGFITAKLLRINVYKDPRVTVNWSGEISEQILNAIEKTLSGVRRTEEVEKVVENLLF